MLFTVEQAFVGGGGDEIQAPLKTSAWEARPPPVYQDFSTRHDWPVKRAIANLPIIL